MENQNQTWEEVNPGIWKPEKEGDNIIGILKSKEPADKANNMSAKYRIQNKEGLFLVWGSAVLDDKMLAIDVETQVRITFEGKKDIGKGRTLNMYKVEQAAKPLTETPVDETEEITTEDAII